ncbi:radical SAM protein [Methanosarcina sp. 1.H.A.2.2]|uniref:radical SAM protein n=1 Tax=Methanosarcina sp. 1.H.A.2.2 TaxID=1483601 RepID=UPI000621862D|nr:radical SAM protein [Methanosarcina sp. 1.H.A.2.2]KKH49343.1 radical SAM protein [Methanosarcina sp. 1.H.A.2.2]
MQCNVCEFGCEINEYSRGRCGTYVCTGDTIVQAPDMGYLGAYPVSIETIPLLHYYPSGKFLQVFSTGCNFQCSGCVARLLSSGKSLPRSPLPPSQVVERALQQQCLGVVSTLNEPAANYYLFRDLAVQAKEKGLLVGCSTNCYFTGETLSKLGQLVDFMNVGIKGYSDRSYINCGVPSSAPVFRNISRLFDMGVHVETSVVYCKGNEEDVIKVAEAVSDISSTIPVQVMRFIPFGDAPIELEPSIGEVENLCTSLRKHVDYVYLFNSPGTELLNTYCPECGGTLTEREFYGPMGSRSLKPWINYTCKCGKSVPVKGITAIESFSEEGFMGGYRISRAFGMVHAVLTCLGILDDSRLIDVWRKISDFGTLMQIHHMIQQPYAYLEFIRLIAEMAGVPKKGEELISFIRTRLELVRSLAAENSNDVSHKVYYCMGSPLFALNAGRMENSLVTFSGGVSINKQLQKEGKPGVNVSPSFINEHNPDTIFISGFLSRPLDEFYALCRQYGIHADAVKQQRVYAVPPSWDFGNPRWLLGLMYIADKLHPGNSGIDLQKEADEFYMQFYGLPFEEATPNRSFHSPSSGTWPRQVLRCTHA